MVLQGRGEKDDVSIRKTICEVEFIVTSKYEIKIKALGCTTTKVSNKASIGLMTNFSAELFIFIKNFCSYHFYIAHL
jgi:hypothetical protein